MGKVNFYSGMFCTHKNLGVVYIDESCIYLNALNSDPTSCFVVHDGETKEVSLAMIAAVIR